MPRFLVPRNHTPHRVAAIALYRALLQQCSAAPFSDEQRSTLQNVVRNKFKRNADVQSTRLLKLAFCAGYEALDRLDDSIAGSASSHATIVTLLSQTPPHLLRPPRAKPASEESKLEPPDLPLPPGTGPLSTRPQLKLAPGKVRRVPKLVSANGIPFLRLTKPQPLSLTRQINDRVKQQQARFTYRDWMEEYLMPLARREDEWDEIAAQLARREGVRLGSAREESSRQARGKKHEKKDRAAERNGHMEEEERSWTSTCTEELRRVASLTTSAKDRWSALAAKMQDIIDQETDLALKEKWERMQEKQQKREERRAARLAGVHR